MNLVYFAFVFTIIHVFFIFYLANRFIGKLPSSVLTSILLLFILNATTMSLWLLSLWKLHDVLVQVGFALEVVVNLIFIILLLWLLANKKMDV